MSKIDKLIQQYCPDGVEFVRLSSVCDIKGRIGFRGYTKNDQVPEGEGALSLSPINIQNGLVVYDKGTFITWEKYEESPEIMTYNGDIIFCKTASVGKVALVKNLPYKATINPQLVVLKNIKCNPSYLAYCLKTEYFQRKVVHLAGVGSVPNISQKVMGEIEVPLPPLPIQEEIVRILDAYSEKQIELQKELQEEHITRQQQYQYYRDKLLSFEGRNDVEWKKLGEVASIKTGRRFVRTDIKESGVPCFHYGDIYTYYGLTATKTKGYLDAELASKLRFAQPNDVVVVCAGENDWDLGIGVAWLGDEPAVVHDACCILHHSQNPRYISHYLRTHNYHLQMKRYAKNGKISSLPSSGLSEALIPIPSLEEQERIASILDRFDSLVNDLSKAIPAEVEARKQQYEYYRDEILTFKRF